MKTILHISKYYYPMEGGIETVAKYLVEGLTEYKNVVICFATNGETGCDIVNGVKVYRVKPLFKVSSQDICFSYWSVLKKVCMEYKPDIALVHCPNPFIYPIANMVLPKTCKKVLLWHSDILNKGWLYKLIKPVEYSILSRCDLILATSPNYVDESSPIYAYKDKVKILQNGMITEDFDLREGDAERIEVIKKEHGYRKLVLFVGRHIPYKGIEQLIQSEKYIKSDIRILIAGRGPETDKLKKLSKNNERIVFLGKVSNDDLRCYYRAADIFGFSSITKQEAFGIALAEAMYCGCVPVTYRLKGSGVNWVNIKGVTGEEVALGDVQSYASAIDNILNDEQLRQKYQNASKERIKENFTAARAVGKARELLNAL